MNSRQPVVELRDVTFGYGRVPVLDHVSLTIHARDFLAVIGPNGGGKSTLVKVILGLLRPWSGEVLFHTAMPRGRIGYMPQFSTFDTNFPLRVLEVVMMGKLGVRGLMRRYSAQDRADALRALRRLRLERLAEAPVSSLSGGELQRALIARAIVADPMILFLDEPTASVDAESREALATVLHELNREIPIVVVTHDVTSLASQVKQFACLNRRLYYHETGELTGAMLEEVYGCPVELISHGVPHRVLQNHDEAQHGGD